MKILCTQIGEDMGTLGSDLLRGNTDTIILRFLNEKDSYGYAINRRVADLTEGKFMFNEATLYTAFRRLEKAGWIRSYWGSEERGARRRYYTITEEGKQAYADNLEEFTDAVRMMERLVR